MTKLTDNTKTILLKQPILRGETEITEITLRKPNITALKGLKLLDLMQSDVNSLALLLPKITMPMLTKADIERLDISDFTKLATAVFEVMDLAGDDDEQGKSE